jgi:hypothetical protein
MAPRDRSAQETLLRRTVGASCPIELGVWNAYEADPGEPIDLLIRIKQDSDLSPPQVAKLLAQDAPDTVVRIVRDYMSIQVAFERLFTDILPLTSWRTLLPLLGSYSAEDAEAELSAARSESVFLDPTPLDDGDAGATPSEQRWRARWLLLMLDRLAEANQLSTADLLERANDQATKFGRTTVASVGANRPVVPAVFMSRSTIKADAAEQLFDVDCERITWAVIDTGIDAAHPSFAGVTGSRVVASYDIPGARAALDEKERQGPRPDRRPGLWLTAEVDWDAFEAEAAAQAANIFDRFYVPDNGHGSHVAGVLAANRVAPPPVPPGDETPGEARAGSSLAGVVGVDDFEPDEDREGSEAEDVLRVLRGVCPTLRLVDINVYDRKGRATELDVMLALGLVEYINRRMRLGENRRIDGVNLSQTVPFLARLYACGWSPICQATDSVVRSGVVVVASAGNGGYDVEEERFSTVSITDPGNTERSITVGVTHRTEPHRFGPIAGSGRGPTADGRHKPDLLAPGHSIVAPLPRRRVGARSGTSQAAAHVSGVAAMLLARYPELCGRPEMVKDILCRTATDLGRVSDFQGHGLLDALRAMQEP